MDFVAFALSVPLPLIVAVIESKLIPAQSELSVFIVLLPITSIFIPSILALIAWYLPCGAMVTLSSVRVLVLEL